MSAPRPVVDVSRLPDFAFGARTLMWWATFCLVCVESVVFVLTAVGLFYLQGNEIDIPPGATREPDLLAPSINTIILLVSLWPNQVVKTAAENLDVLKARRWILVADVFAVAFLVVRVFEFGRLNVMWDGNAYGSMVWTLLGLHTAHLLTDFFDSAVLSAMMWLTPVDGKRLADVAENCSYWYFVVLTWLPIYFLIYVMPRVWR